LHVRPCPGEHSDAVVYHDAPTSAGDSGGPVVDGAGRLVGVTSRITSSWRGWRVAAVRPSAELLARFRR
nr:trypsin-like peptidase domain-containing protein [Planctomycetota bacterium]